MSLLCIYVNNCSSTGFGVGLIEIHFVLTFYSRNLSAPNRLRPPLKICYLMDYGISFNPYIADNLSDYYF